MGMVTLVISPIRMAMISREAMRTHELRTFLETRRDLFLSEVFEVAARQAGLGGFVLPFGDAKEL